MRKLVAIIFVLMIVCTNSTGFCEEQQESHDYRNCNWGMTLNEVKEAEGDVVWEINDSTQNADGYIATIGTIECLVVFNFDSEGKLNVGTIMDNSVYSNYMFYIGSFETFETALTKKYGKPKEANDIWLNDPFGYYKDNKSEWGNAIATGRLFRLYTWETNDTQIQLMLGLQGNEIVHAIQYVDKNNMPSNEVSGL